MDAQQAYEEWCRRIKTSDHGAFEQVFRRLHDALFRYALYITDDEAAARDIVQDVFLQLWERRSTLDPSRSLKSLLYRMVRNASYNHQRDRRTREGLLRERGGLHESPPVLPDSTVNAKTLNDKLQALIGALPERQREALLLSRFQGLSHQEVAAVMDVSPRTVNNHLVRALRSLRDGIRALEPDLLKP